MPPRKAPKTVVRTGVTTGTAVSLLFLSASAAFAAAAFTRMPVKPLKKIQLPTVDVVPVVRYEDYNSNLGRGLHKMLDIEIKVTGNTPITFNHEPQQPRRLVDIAGSFFGRTYTVDFVRRDGTIVDLANEETYLFIGTDRQHGYYEPGTQSVTHGDINLRALLDNEVTNIRVTIDPQNQIAETNESNNTIEIPVVYPEGLFGQR